MATIHIHRTTTLTPEQFIAGLTDFGPGRSELFPNSADGYLEVHDQGPGQADVTEGSSGIWERLHYDWSDPSRVVLTTTDSNVWGGNSGHTYTFTKSPDGDDQSRRRRGPRRQELQRTGARDRGPDHRQAHVGQAVGQDRQGNRSPQQRAEAGRAHVDATTAPVKRQLPVLLRGRSHCFSGFVDELGAAIHGGLRPRQPSSPPARTSRAGPVEGSSGLRSRRDISSACPATQAR